MEPRARDGELIQGPQDSWVVVTGDDIEIHFTEYLFRVRWGI